MTSPSDRPAAPVAAGPGLRQRQAQELLRRLGEPLISGNHVELLRDGTAAHAALLQAIDGATDHVNLESCGIAPGPFADELAQRLVARCRAGVRVNLLFGLPCPAERGDRVAATPLRVAESADRPADDGTPTDLIAGLQRAGASVCESHAMPRWRRRVFDALRLHRQRRLVIVDGRVGFVGGVGPRDFQIGLQGPVLQRLQRLFIAHWQRDAEAPMQHARYFPALAPAGAQRIGIAASDAGRPNAFGHALQGAVEMARSNIVLATADALPPRPLQQALERAAGNGVTVDLFLPAAADDWAAWSPLAPRRIRQLTAAGVRIHRRPAGSLHVNACTVDGVWAGIGDGHLGWRAGLDATSTDLVLLDEGFALRLQQLLREDSVAGPADAVAPAAAGWQHGLPRRSSGAAR